MRRQVINALIITIIVLGVSLWIDFFPKSFQNVTKRDVSTRLGLDLRGGSQIFLKPRDGVATQEQLTTAAGVIDQRVNGLGVSEAVVQTSENSIIVELPGVTDAAQASASLRGTGNLEFIDPKGDFLQEGTEVCTTATPRFPPPLPVLNPSVTGPGGATTPTTPTTALSNTTGLSETTSLTPTTPITPTTPLAPTTSVTETERPCTPDVQYTTIARGTELDLTRVSITTDQAGNPAVSFALTGESASSISSFTAQNIGRPMSVILDNRVISSPVINGALPGEGIITMGDTLSRQQQSLEAERLFTQLRFGALPISLVEDGNRTVSATLGETSIQASQRAGAIGLLVVMLFMVMYYRLPGVIADIALLIYTAISFAVFKLVPITLTLPGIAGFILSIGLAVDANILIFARIKEELQRGRSMNRAIEDGFNHAWPSIRDSNAATLITCFILYVMGNSFGVSIIQGFALTLALGIMVSLFTAITVSRMLLRMLVDFGVTNPRWFGVQPVTPEIVADVASEA